MFRSIMKTRNDFAICLLRVGLGAAMWPHGAQKALGMYNGAGIEGTVEWFVTMGIPSWQAYLVIAAEFLGAIGLMLGVFGRLAALGIVAVMAGAIHHVHLEKGFFASNGGYEYPAFLIVAALVIAIRGSGALSLDRKLSGGGGGGE